MSHLWRRFIKECRLGSSIRNRCGFPNPAFVVVAKVKDDIYARSETIVQFPNGIM